MNKTPVIAIFDVGKTNKKLFLFDRQYAVVWERTEQFAETMDDDGDPCEDLDHLTRWLRTALDEVLALPQFDVQAVNFSAYGASLVYIGADGEPVGYLYNYLKPFSNALRQQFYAQYGPEAALSVQTASPALDSLNSGLQLYRFKHERPELLAKVAYALHLPQYLSYLISNWPVAELTSIGCHTMLWNFQSSQYHDWVKQEGLEKCLGSIVPSDSAIETCMTYGNGSAKPLKVGTGLHDSSAALIPYLASFSEPFVLISTGTWCISLNPFNTNPLTAEELQYDCLCYLTYRGQPVKASRLFAGHEHEQQVRRLADHFGVPVDTYKGVAYDPALIRQLQGEPKPTRKRRSGTARNVSMTQSSFVHRELSLFSTYELAYHQLMLDLVAQQLISTELVLHGSPVRRIFVDGGFSHNPIYMALLAEAFPELEVWAASVAQATALGAALAIHDHWNPQLVPTDLIDLMRYWPGR